MNLDHALDALDLVTVSLAYAARLVLPKPGRACCERRPRSDAMAHVQTLLSVG